MRFLLIVLTFFLQPHSAFSLPSLNLINPSLSLTQNTAVSNLSKPTSDTFPIPYTDLILRFEEFGPLLNVFELGQLLHKIQNDIQTLINDRGANAQTPYDTYHRWQNEKIVFDIEPLSPVTLGQFRNMIEGLELYMIDGVKIYGRRYREATFSLLREGVGDVGTLTLAEAYICSVACHA